MGKKRIIKKTEELVGAGEEKKVAERTSTKTGAVRVARGIANILATYNNTIVTITDERGNVLAWASAGAVGFSGTKKATSYAAARVAEIAAEKAKKRGVEGVSIRVSGIGSGRDSAIRALANQGLSILSIRDITPVPHNGPRPKKVRRV